MLIQLLRYIDKQSIDLMCAVTMKWKPNYSEFSVQYGPFSAKLDLFEDVNHFLIFEIVGLSSVKKMACKIYAYNQF